MHIASDRVKETTTTRTGTVTLAGAVSGYTVTLPVIRNLTDGLHYRIKILFSTTEGAVKEGIASIKATP